MNSRTPLLHIEAELAKVEALPVALFIGSTGAVSVLKAVLPRSALAGMRLRGR